MFPKYFHSVILAVGLLQWKGAASFFVKEFSYRYGRGRCINVTGQIQSSGSWGNLFYLEFSYDSCLDPSAQFRFRDNGAMLNLEKQGCLAAMHKSGSGYDLDMFYLYVDSVSLDTNACAQKPNQGIYRAINQTSTGALSVYYKGKGSSSFQTWCARWRSHNQLYKNYSIQYYIGLRTQCYDRFLFGSVTCYGEKVKNANCPKGQYMVVKIASFRGLTGAKTCGLSDDYSCEVDATCLVKKKCDGLHECSFTVDDSFVSGDLCPGLSNYLYFEYQCTDTVKPYKEPCVRDMSLSYSSVPYEGVVQITTDSVTKNVCWESLKNNNNAQYAVCHHLGYYEALSLINVSASTDAKHATFSGSINCNGDQKYLSQCSINSSTSESCSQLSYIHCMPYDPYFYFYFFRWWRIGFRPLLENVQRFPDSSFTASASVKGHSASDARISSGSSWCAPVSDEKHYLQVDLRRLHHVYFLITYGDSTSRKWVATYNVNYTVDLVSWEIRTPVYQGNKNAYDHVASKFLYIRTKALRFIPLAYVGQPCMRVDIFGESIVPDKPRNLTVSNITSSSAVISWLHPKDHGRYGYSSRFLIKLKKENIAVLSIATGKVNEYELNNLTSYTTFEISVASGNHYGFGEESVTSFLTSEEAPSGPPLNIKTTSRSASSLLVTWDPPEKTKRNGIIISYTACVSHSEDGFCFQKFISGKKEWLIRHLNASTKHYIRVLASTKVGHGNYSESNGFFTNGKPAEKARNETSSTLTFSLQKPSKLFVYFYVVALKLEDGKDFASPDNYRVDDLVTYAEARNLTIQKPYIAAVITSSGADGNVFILGDGRRTNHPRRQKRGSNMIGYFNGPLEPGASYSIFQRIIINDEGDYYSTDWSPASKTIRVTVSGQQVPGRSENNDGSEKYLAGIIVLVILLIIACAVIAYFIYQIRVKSPNTEPKPETTNDQTNSRNIYDMPLNNYEVPEDDHSTYTALKRPAPGESSDDHVYGHLNPALKDVQENQGPTGP